MASRATRRTGALATRVALATRAALFAALGDPLRLKIADELATSDRTPGELLEWVDVSSALLTHHLDVLEAAGVIERTTSHADGRKRFVRLVPRHRHLLAPRTTPRNVVFVCTHNSARSQLAAGLWQQLTGQPASSAGTEPAERVHPLALETARRRGLNLKHAEPRHATASLFRGATVITVCDQAHDDLSRTIASPSTQP
ncbi:MAG: ArsR family transcriptional regulator, partial [Actinobacteria bacterium]|nr:ArsR family transcriptional regulator [Actinomycetota bacterium]